jgi:TRAP-type C4-dicarboxylate transport system permease small subunit
MQQPRQPAAAPPRSAFARIVDLFGSLGVAALLVPTLLVCADIAWRRIVGGAFVDVFDITQLCLVACAAWTIPYGFVHRTHIGMDLLVARLPARARNLLELVAHLVSAALFLLLAWLAWNAARLHHAYQDTTQNLGIPVTWHWGIFLAGLVLSILACLWRARRALGAGRGDTADSLR